MAIEGWLQLPCFSRKIVNSGAQQPMELVIVCYFMILYFKVYLKIVFKVEGIWGIHVKKEMMIEEELQKS